MTDQDQRQACPVRRDTALDAIATLEAVVNTFYSDDEFDQGLHHPLRVIEERLIDELRLGLDGNLGDDPEWLVIEQRADEIGLELRLGLPLS